MVLDLKELKAILNREVVDRFDHRFLNKEVPPFDRTIPTVENIAIEIWNRILPSLRTPPEAARGTRLRDAGPVRRLFRRAGMIRVTRRYEFSASHRLHAPALDGGRESPPLRKMQQPVRARPQLRA